MDMRLAPRLPPNSIGDTGLIHSVFRSKFGLSHRSCQSANLTNSLLGQLSRRFAPNIHDQWHRFKVVWVDTRSITAKVVNSKSIGDRSNIALIEDAGGARRLSIVSRVSISMRNLALPHPTGRGIAAILNDVERSGLGLSPAMVALNVTLRGIPNVAGLAVRLLRQRRLASTSAHAQAGWVRPGSLRRQLHRHDTLRAGRAPHNRLTTTRNGRTAIGTFSSRLGMHFWSLLHRFRGAMPRAVGSSAGAFCVPSL